MLRCGHRYVQPEVAQLRPSAYARRSRMGEFNEPWLVDVLCHKVKLRGADAEWRYTSNLRGRDSFNRLLSGYGLRFSETEETCFGLPGAFRWNARSKLRLPS